MLTDRLRATVFEANTNNVLSRDLVIIKPHIVANLSAPSTIDFEIPQSEEFNSSLGIDWKNWGQWVLIEQEIDHIVHYFAEGVVTDFDVDDQNGNMKIQTTGVLGYPHNLPWLENFNPIAVDPYEVIERIIAHLQGFPNANLNLFIDPSSSGTQMLPGYSFDGNILNFNFFAMFIRAIDLTDCGDIITGLARDIPFDIIEDGLWNDDRTEFTRYLRLAYPQGGSQQDNLTFQYGVNVIKATPAKEMDIEPVSDVIIRSWRPGKVISSTLSNADSTRLRRTILEEDANIESTERAAALAKRKLQKRQVPKSFSKITIDPNHSNAPFGSFWLGDSIYIQGTDYPWYGTIEGWHRVVGIDYDEEKGFMDLDTKVAGAFNYDPIDYDPDYADQPVVDLNRLANGYFAHNLSGWTTSRGQWFRDTLRSYQTVYNTDSATVRIDCDDSGEIMYSHRVNVVPGEHLRLQCVVEYDSVTSDSGQPGFQLLGITSLDGDTGAGETFVIDEITHPTGVVAWQQLKDTDWTVPDGINELALQFNVTNHVTGGTAWWTYARIVPADSPEVTI